MQRRLIISKGHRHDGAHVRFDHATMKYLRKVLANTRRKQPNATLAGVVRELVKEAIKRRKKILIDEEDFWDAESDSTKGQ